MVEAGGPLITTRRLYHPGLSPWACVLDVGTSGAHPCVWGCV